MCAAVKQTADIVSTWRATIINTDKARVGLACSMNKPSALADGRIDRQVPL